MARPLAWLEDFWDTVIAARPGRRWVVASLFEHDLNLRDALAHALLRVRLHRRDVDYRYVRAWLPEPGRELGEREDILFLGRTKPFTASALAPIAWRLESEARGRFRDPPDGRTGNAIRYEQRDFKRHELEAPPESYRRCDTDYGVLLVRGGDGQRVVALAGLSSLGTLGLTLVLTDDARREALADQVRRIAEDLEPDCPETAEICVRIEVPGEQQLANFLNTLDFTFSAEAVAFSRFGADGKLVQQPVWFNMASQPVLRLVPGEVGAGTVSVAGQPGVILTGARFTLLRRLVEAPEKATPEELCRLMFASAQKVDKGERVRLAKLVHDLNVNLRQIPGLPPGRLVRFSKREGRYVLSGVGGVVAGPVPAIVFRRGRGVRARGYPPGPLP
jgi:hypothetical protein